MNRVASDRPATSQVRQRRSASYPLIVFALWVSAAAQAQAQVAASAEPKLYGRYEVIKLPELNQVLEAKLDTGAKTASLSAKDIEFFSHQGRDWVRFRLAVAGADQRVHEHPVQRFSRIKKRPEERIERRTRETEWARRPVLLLVLCLGLESRRVEVNLADRRSFNYPLLVGAEALREFGAAVDPARMFSAGRPAC